MGFFNKKYETPTHYKPINKKGQKVIGYSIVAIIIFAIVYILSFYI